MIKAVSASRHECHQQATAHKHRSRILVSLQPFANILQQREILTKSLDLSAPLPKPAVDVIITGGHRFLRLRFRDFQIRFTRGPLNCFLHRL